MRAYPSVLIVILAIAAACNDDLGSQRAAIVESSIVLYSLARPDLVSLPSAYDFYSRVTVRVEGPSASGFWDVALTERDGGFALAPPGVFPGLEPLRAGVAVIEDVPFDELRRAPAEDAAYVRTELVPLQGDRVYVVRGRRIDTCVFYAKLRVAEQDAELGSVTIEYLLNPNCGDRSLVPES